VSRKKPVIIHPFLFAAFPILFLFAHNIKELEFFALIIPITLVLLFASLLLFLSKLILKDSQKAAAIVSLALVLLFSYGQFVYLTDDFRSSLCLFIGKFILGPKKLIFITEGAFFCLGK